MRENEKLINGMLMLGSGLERHGLGFASSNSSLDGTCRMTCIAEQRNIIDSTLYDIDWREGWPNYYICDIFLDNPDNKSFNEIFWLVRRMRFFLVDEDYGQIRSIDFIDQNNKILDW